MEVFGENLLVGKIVYDGYFSLDQEKLIIWSCFSNLINTSTNPSQ